MLPAEAHTQRIDALEVRARSLEQDLERESMSRALQAVETARLLEVVARELKELAQLLVAELRSGEMRSGE